MKRTILAALVVTLALAAPVAASPDPADLVGVDPYTTFVVTRILPNQREVLLDTFSVDDGFTNEQVIRATVVGFVRTERVNNPAWVIVIYGPIDLPSSFYTNGDRIWDSRTDQ
jgi:hypothetical protein